MTPAIRRQGFGRPGIGFFYSLVRLLMSTPSTPPSKPDLLAEVRAHVAQYPARDFDLSEKAEITRFGKVVIDTGGVKVHD